VLKSITLSLARDWDARTERMRQHLAQGRDCLRADHLSHLVLVLIARQHALAVMAGLVPAIHALTRVKTWMAVSGTAMTMGRGRLNRAEV
jgi:hypothetical protein